MLIPDDHPIGAKRICTDSNYFQTFNEPHVALISVRSTPITSVDAAGINTTEAHVDVDAIVFATGFDALTGSLGKIDIAGRGGERLRDDWADGPRTYLGLADDGFPNLFMVTGPGSPAVLANMVLGAEAHVDWIAEAIGYLDENGYAAIEATPDAVDNWLAECAQRAEATLFTKANSWYLGANIPGKPRVFMLFCGGFGVYNEICAEVAALRLQGIRTAPGLIALQEAQGSGLEGLLLLDHHPVPAVGKHVQFGIGDGAHRNQRHVQRADPVVAPPRQQGGSLDLVHDRPGQREVGVAHHLRHRRECGLAVHAARARQRLGVGGQFPALLDQVSVTSAGS